MIRQTVIIKSNLIQCHFYDILVTHHRFNSLDKVVDMFNGITFTPSKCKWSTLVQEKGWEGDDLYWVISNILHKENNV